MVYWIFFGQPNYSVDSIDQSDEGEILCMVYWFFFDEPNSSVDSIDQSDEGKHIVYGILIIFCLESEFSQSMIRTFVEYG